MIALEKTRWGVVTFLFGLGILGAAQAFKMSPALPEIRQELGLSLVAGGILFSIINITPALIGVGAGSLVDHFGYRRTLIVSLFGLAISGFLGSFSQTPDMMLLFRFCEGVSVLGIIITSPAMMSSITLPRQRNLTLSIWSSYLPTGAAIMMLISPYLLEEMGWRSLWQLSAGVSLVMAFIMIFAIKTPKLATHKKSFRDLGRRLGDVLSRPVPWVLTLSFLFYTAIQGPLMAWMPTYLIESKGMTVMAAGIVTAIVIISNVGGTMLGGFLMTKGLRHWQLVCLSGFFILIASFSIFRETASDGLRFLSCLSVVGISGILPSAIVASVPQFSPSFNHVATLNGMVIQGAQAGHFIGPPLYAFVVHQAGGDWSSASILFVVLSVMIMGAGVILRRYSHHSEEI